MSAEAMKWARQQRFGTMPMTALVKAIAARADKTGATWAAQETLADDVGASVRYVRKLLAKAEQLGIVARVYRSGGSRGRMSDMVTLALHKTFCVTAAQVRKTAPSGTRVPVATSARYRNKTALASGTRVPGINKGIISSPSHREETYQKEALAAGPVRLAAVGGVTVEGGR